MSVRPKKKKQAAQRKPKLMVLTLKDKTYGFNELTVAVGRREQFAAFVEKKFGVADQKPTASACHLHLEKDGDCKHLLWLESWENDIGHIALLTHEIVHYAFSHLGEVGFKPGTDGDEAYTYFIQNTLTDIYRALRKRISS